jgi:hypothetical protein
MPGWSSWSLWGIPSSQYLIRDTVFFGDSGTGLLTELADDDSQYATDLTVGAGGITEASSHRFLENTERTIDVRFTADNADSGTFWQYGSQRLSLTAGGTIVLTVNGGTAFSFDGTSLFSGSDAEYQITWADRPSTPEGGSGGTAQTAHVYLWNVTSGGFVRGERTHSTPTATLTTAAIWAQDGAGTGAFTGGRLAFRFSRGFHTATETFEELVSPSSDPTLAGEERTEILVPPRSTGIGDDGYLSGPTIIRAAAAVRRNDLRLAGPLVNMEARTRATHRGDRVGDEPFVYEDPDTGAWLYMHWLTEAPIPPGVNRVKARAFVQQWRVGGNADDLEVTCYSLNRPGFVYRPPTSPVTIEVRRNTQTRNSSDGTGATAGAWVTFDNLRIARDLDGWSYFALGFAVVDAGGAGSVDDQLWTVKRFIVDPIFEDAPDQLPGLGG